MPPTIAELTEAMRVQSERALRMHLEAMGGPDENQRPYRPAAVQAARRQGDPIEAELTAYILEAYGPIRRGG